MKISNKVKKMSVAFFLGGAIVFAGCNASNTTKGTAIGAGSGAAIGGVIGNQSGNTAVGAILGAAIGGTAGAIIGNHMDKQAEELEKDLEGADVERVAEGIKITFDSGLLFALESAELSETTRQNLRELAETLQKYDETEILIEGHTDASGSDEFNQKLSVDRAESVADFLAEQGVKKSRLKTEGYGESQPIADNTTEEGRQQNRRVEVAIYANKKMQKAAENGELGELEDTGN